MKYICLGYIEPGKFEGMTEDERHATFDECFEYNDHLRANGHLVDEVPLQPPETALTLPQVRYGLSVLLLEVCCPPGIDAICRHVHRQLMRNELARFYHHRTRKCMPPRKLRRNIQ